MTVSGRRTASVLSGLTSVAVVAVLAGCTGAGSSAPSASPPHTDVRRTGPPVSSATPAAVRPPVSPTDVVVTGASRLACPKGTDIYPTSIALHATGPSYLYFDVEAPASDGWKIDLASLGITVTESTSESSVPVLLRAQNFTDSEAGPHSAALTSVGSGYGRLDCRFTFWLKHGTRLTMTERTGDVVRLSGRLTRSTFGPHARMAGDAGQVIRIQRWQGRKHAIVQTLRTDAAGRFATTVPVGPYRWEALFAGDAETVSNFSYAKTS